MPNSPRTRVDERRSARGCDCGWGQLVGVEEQGEDREGELDVRQRRKRWCAYDVKHPRVCAIATARVGVGVDVGRIRGGAPAPTPSAENVVARWWMHEGIEREKVE
jgi:hypothetical protein